METEKRSGKGISPQNTCETAEHRWYKDLAVSSVIGESPNNTGIRSPRDAFWVIFSILSLLSVSSLFIIAQFLQKRKTLMKILFLFFEKTVAFFFFFWYNEGITAKERQSA
jgi:hypothetical protein